MGRYLDRTRHGLSREYRSFMANPVDWFLLTGHRLLISAVGLLILYAVLLLAVLTDLAPLIDRTPILFVLFALISGNVTLITIVVSISQFILARHLESPGEIRDQLREMLGFRQDVGDITHESVLPVTPSGFFLLLFRSIQQDLDALRSSDPGMLDDLLADDLEHVIDPLEGHAKDVISLVENRPRKGRADLYAVLDADYSQFFYRSYQLRANHLETLPESLGETVTRLERKLEQVDVARRYFKTVFIQSQLASLSRQLLYIGLPVLVISVVLMLLFTASPGLAISQSTLVLLLPIVVTAGFAPIFLLSAYILRLSTVVHRSAAMYPFTTAENIE